MKCQGVYLKHQLSRNLELKFSIRNKNLVIIVSRIPLSGLIVASMLQDLGSGTDRVWRRFETVDRERQKAHGMVVSGHASLSAKEIP